MSAYVSIRQHTSAYVRKPAKHVSSYKACASKACQQLGKHVSS
jgi:hypothetical protein